MTRKLYAVHGQELTIQQWGERLGVKWKTLWARIKNGMPLEEAIALNVQRMAPKRDMSKVVEKKCLLCGNGFLVPLSRDWREHCCSSECKKQYRHKAVQDARESRKRNCLVCGSIFYPRQSQIDGGMGVVCSNRCGLERAHAATNKPEVRRNAAATLKAGYAEGRLSRVKGPDNPSWKGGKEAAKRRRMKKSAEYTREWRRRNPDRVREQDARRRGNKIGRLPKGAVSRLMLLQRGKCAICKIGIIDGYHMDHIYPLHRGGKHEPYNIQLLCPTCNVRKSAKDPIKYMQEIGMLL